ncbi:MAG: hypothetical protein JWM44_1980 [Bacilli bacterium]|nr:hypothetical protein [Bacilli bacterium]
MFKEYENLKAVLASMDDREAVLQGEIRQKGIEKEKAEAKYQLMIEEDAEGSAVHSSESLSKLKKKIEELDSDIALGQERLSKIAQTKQLKSRELHDGIIAGWQRETAVLRQELQQRFDAMLEYRAKLTLAVCEAHEIYNKADQMRSMIAEVDRLANPIGYTIRSHSGISNQVPIDSITGENDGILPDPDELHRVFNSGWLPDWVKHYSETGEIIKTGPIKKQKQDEARLKQQEEQERLQQEEDQLVDQEEIEHEINFGRGQSK